MSQIINEICERRDVARSQIGKYDTMNEHQLLRVTQTIILINPFPQPIYMNNVKLYVHTCNYHQQMLFNQILFFTLFIAMAHGFYNVIVQVYYKSFTQCTIILSLDW